MLFRKVLIANRGEIALRVIRTCQQMGIKTVAIYSEADVTSRHIAEADEAFCVGSAPAADSYLNIDRILDVAQKARVDAIHPGYGFLSENDNFAFACNKYGIKFIGPAGEVIGMMGKKVVARQTALAHGIPVVPGSPAVIRGLKEALRTAKGLGYPVLIKPSAGGGGKGIRVARNEYELKDCLTSCGLEAGLSFASAGIFMEKYLEKARHIEVQVLADQHGNIIHLGERDCTIQRRHQKLTEESPSPALDHRLRERMAAAALRLAAGIGYTNAGTVEFVLDQEGNYYFIEMNTRIQVEHPVTEMVTGIDLIRQQILIAGGEKLNLTQADIIPRGWAIECRINAEDPDRNFLPCPGTIMHYQKPIGEGVRVDDYVYNGYTFPYYYDSLLGKVITWGSTREEAIKRMQKALDDFKISGIKTTLPFQQKLLTHPAYWRGEVHTTFVQEMLGHGRPVRLIAGGRGY